MSARHVWSRLASTLAVLALVSVPALGQEAPRSPTPSSIPIPARVTEVARGLEHPWGLAFLPDGRMLVTERPGACASSVATDSSRRRSPACPRSSRKGRAGCSMWRSSPDFAQDRLVYLSFAEPGSGGAGTAVARGRLGERGLEGTQVIWRQEPKVSGANHWGSRLVFRPDGTLFVTLGDRYGQRDRAQDLTSTLGKIVRINADGSVPRDNPFVGRGRRSPGDLVVRPPQCPERGARRERPALDGRARRAGGDELNQPEAGKNYGWPVITYGVDYSGAPIGEGTARPGMEQPVYYWDPVIAPSGAIFYTGAAFPDWRGDLFVGSLQPGRLVRLQIADDRVVREERYLGDLGERIRDVRQGPDGLIYLLTDNPRGRILRLEPPKG